MSYDILLFTCNRTEQTREGRHPRTGEIIQIPDHRCSEEDRAKIQELFESVDAHGPDDYNCYLVGFADGGRCEAFFSFDDPHFAGGVISTREFSKDLAKFIYDLANVGNLSIADLPVVTTQRNADRIRVDYPSVEVVGSAEDVYIFLGEGFEKWQSYRNRVLQSNDQEADEPT